MKKFRYISPLSKTQLYELEELRKGSSEAKTRSRAHAIVLSSEGFTIEELMEIFKVKRDTISRWLNNWEQCGLKGLHDKVRSGRIPVLNEDEKNVLKKLIKENSRSSKIVVSKLFNQTGKNLSHWSIKRLAKDLGLSWKRVRKSCKSKRDEKKFRQAQSELEALERVALTNAKNLPKKENQAEPKTKATESDIEVFKQLVNREWITIFDNNLAKIGKPETNEVATQTDDSSKKDVLNEVSRHEANRNKSEKINKANQLFQSNGAAFETKTVPNSETEEPQIVCVDFQDKIVEWHGLGGAKWASMPILPSPVVPQMFAQVRPASALSR